MNFRADVNINNFKEKGYSAFLEIPKNYTSSNDSITLVSEKQLGISTEEKVTDQINAAIRNKAFLENNINKKVLDSINDIDEEKLYKFSTVIKQGNKTEQSNSGLSYGIGFGSGILIYMTLFIYGAAVMRGVMEEKMSRIAEVIISSVKPFQLMLGKIIGIAAVGITQLLIWIILIVGLSSIATTLISHDVLQHAQSVSTSMGPAANNSAAIGFLKYKEYISPGELGNYSSLLPFLFCWRIFVLCSVICSSGQRCKRRSPGSTIINAADYDAYHFIICYYDYSRRQARCTNFCLGQHDTFFFSDSDDGPHSFG